MSHITGIDPYETERIPAADFDHADEPDINPSEETKEETKE